MRFVMCVVALLVSPFVSAQSVPSESDVESRVDAIVGKMTTDEKIELIGGINDFYTRAIPGSG